MADGRHGLARVEELFSKATARGSSGACRADDATRLQQRVEVERVSAIERNVHRELVSPVGELPPRTFCGLGDTSRVSAPA